MMAYVQTVKDDLYRQCHIKALIYKTNVLRMRTEHNCTPCEHGFCGLDSHLQPQIVHLIFQRPLRQLVQHDPLVLLKMELLWRVSGLGGDGHEIGPEAEHQQRVVDDQKYSLFR